MKRLPIKIKLSLMIVSIITAVIAIVCLLNSLLFEKYYRNNKKGKLESSYNIVKESILNSGIKTGNTSEKIKEIYSLHGINSFIIDSNWNVLLATGNDKESFKWLQRFIFGKDIEIIEIEEKSEYSIVRGRDTITGFSYLVMHGVLYDGTQVVLQITLDSIKENVKISNRFIKITGASVALISIIFVFIFSSKFTRPMKELSKIAEEMSNMNFNAKYTGNSYDEIGKLGKSINSMSESLKENIAKLKEANLDLKKDIEQKEEIARRQREFLGNVSHELKTPIALIEGYAEGLKEGIVNEEESRDYYCDVIIDEALKMDKLVRNLLSLDNVESGKMTTGIERFDLGELIGEIVRSNHIRFSKEKIMCSYNCNDTIYVWYDKIHIEEVFSNFLSNAINHSDGIIKIDITKDEKKATIEVYNSGKNIPESEIGRIWEKFYKVDKARTREYGGNGLGLSIVKAILDTYNAEYGVKNTENGVVFFVTLECE